MIGFSTAVKVFKRCFMKLKKKLYFFNCFDVLLLKIIFK
jgi:hypothetical protein